jgi:hypothetical protein
MTRELEEFCMHDHLEKDEQHSVKEDTGDFYEFMPLTAEHYVFSDDVAVDETTDNAGQTARRTAIITLVAVALVSVLLGILFVKGLNVLKDSGVSPVSSTGSLEP